MSETVRIVDCMCGHPRSHHYPLGDGCSDCSCQEWRAPAPAGDSGGERG
jgi:hypothetical protein